MYMFQTILAVSALGCMTYGLGHAKGNKNT
jgi:hypothetical protein